jgi:HD-like signal output (HDOD) protein
MEGFAFLEHLRRRDQWKQIPVIMLTGDMQKDHIIRAKRLGAADYLLKAQFSVEHMIERVRARLSQPKPPPAPPAGAAPAAAAPLRSDIPRLLDRQQCLQRARQAMGGKTLSGVVAGVLGMAMSPRTEMSDLAELISRDSILAARILRAANKTQYASAHGAVATLSEAIRTIGCVGVRDIAAALGVFDAIPASDADGFNPIRCWQHSLAVASLCARLAQPADQGHAYLIGLCHDLGEILFRGRFASEYRQVIHAQLTTGNTRDELERYMLGMTHGELAQTILLCLELPEAIRKPIDAFHRAGLLHSPVDPLARLLQLADLYANGLLLASSEHSLVRPLSRAEFRAVTGRDEPLALDVPPFRGEILSLTTLLARLSPAEESKLIEPLLPLRPVRVWLARDPSLSAFDPTAAALKLLADTTVHDALPAPDAWPGHDCLVVLSRATSAAGFTSRDIAQARSQLPGKPPTLWLTGRLDENDGRSADPPLPLTWPTSLSRLAEFVAGVNRTD